MPPEDLAHVGPRGVGLTLPADPGSVRLARRGLRDLCQAADLAQVSDDAQLLVSELV